MNKPREELVADGSRWVGDGPTYIVFLKSGDVALMIHGETAEHRALLKNLIPEVTLGEVTLRVKDFLFENDIGVPLYSESLAIFFRSVILHTKTEKEADALLRKLRSVVIAARRLASEPVGKTTHERFRRIVIHLAKQFRRIPTKSEIRQAMFFNAPADRLDKNKNTREVTQLCDKNGLGWLPHGKSGRPRKKKKDT